MAIPTEYGGVRFRSLLEARWAAWFDLSDYRWTYEPFELAGYIPDFLVKRGGQEWIHEIKPATCVDDLWPHIEKLETCGWKGALILAAAPDVMLRTYLGRNLARGRESWKPLVWPMDQWNPANNQIQWKPTRKAAEGRRVPLPPASTEGLADEAVSKLLPAEALLLALIVNGARDLAVAIAALAPADIERLRSANILGAARAFAVEGLEVTRRSIDGSIGAADRRLLSDVAVSRFASDAGSFTSAIDCVRELRSAPLRARMAEIQTALARATGDEALALQNEKLQLKAALHRIQGGF